ncbi:MAG: hypothetical protein FDW93_00505 [Bergeyella sp.]|nr:hypothetical protein [Bergeyella sp.]
MFRDLNSTYIGNIFNKDDRNESYFLRFRNDKFGYFNTELNDLLHVFYELIEKYKIVFKMKKNQGYIINNGRFLHGRTEFIGFREMWRILAFDNFLKYKGFL